MSSAKIEVEKFNGMIDYNLWKEKILAHLEILGLMEALKVQEAQLLKASSSVKEEDIKGKGTVEVGL